MRGSVESVSVNQTWPQNSGREANPPERCSPRDRWQFSSHADCWDCWGEQEGGVAGNHPLKLLCNRRAAEPAALFLWRPALSMRVIQWYSFPLLIFQKLKTLLLQETFCVARAMKAHKIIRLPFLCLQQDSSYSKLPFPETMDGFGGKGLAPPGKGSMGLWRLTLLPLFSIHLSDFL